MKTEEDEAFDELAKRQGAWGGGFPAKRNAAADKQHWNEDEWRRNNWRCHHGWLRGEQCEICNAPPAPQPAQEPVVYQCPRCATSMEIDLTAAPYRPWVGLTDEEIRKIHTASFGKDIGFATGLTEAKLKEKNNGT